MTDSIPRHAAEGRLVRQLEKAQALHLRRATNHELARALDQVADWQSRRLAATYVDLASEPRYRDAIAFFQTDLYGSGNVAKRDADVARVVPIMVAMLPERVIATVAQAMELNVLSHELDEQLLHHLPGTGARFTVAEYCEAYRRSGETDARRHQIALIGEIGRALDVFVGKPMIRASLALMGKPAKLAGFATLHDFLQRGFHAFHQMHGADEFLRTIETRETAILDAIMGGSDAPFPDPLGSPPAEAVPRAGR